MLALLLKQPFLNALSGYTMAEARTLAARFQRIAKGMCPRFDKDSKHLVHLGSFQDKKYRSPGLFDGCED